MCHEHMEDLAVTLVLSVLLVFLAMQDQPAQLGRMALKGLQVIKESLGNLVSRACQGLQACLANLAFHCHPGPQYQVKTEPPDPQEPGIPEQQALQALSVQQDAKVSSGILVSQVLLVLIVLVLALLELKAPQGDLATQDQQVVPAI